MRTPLDAKRAADIACQFVAANKASAQLGRDPGRANSHQQQSSATTRHRPRRARTSTGSKTQNQAAACGSDTKLVINLLTIEGEEQVMLKVTVAEVQRSLLKQFGINIGAVVNSGNFATALLTENALPLTAAAGLGTLPLPGLGTAAFDPTTGITCATTRHSLQLQCRAVRHLRSATRASPPVRRRQHAADRRPCARWSATA